MKLTYQWSRDVNNLSLHLVNMGKIRSLLVKAYQNYFMI